MKHHLLSIATVLSIGTQLLAVHGRNPGELRGLPPEGSERWDMRARADSDVSSSSSSTSTLSSAASSTLFNTATLTSSAPASSSTTSDLSFLPLPPASPPTSPPQPVPTPLDLSISYSLSHSCLTYLTSILPSTLFQSCLPLSLLLTTSTSYSTLLSDAITSSNFTTLNNLISYTSSPQPDSAQCDDYFSGILKAMSDKNNCAADLASRTPIAMTTRYGVGNYQVIREASGLTDPTTGKWCYLEAVADERPDDLYLWSIPAGIPLPKTSTPTCSACSALLLSQYMTSDSTTLNMTTVQSAVNTVNTACGGGFVVYNAAAVHSGATSRLQGPSAAGSASAAVAGWLFLFTAVVAFGFAA